MPPMQDQDRTSGVLIGDRDAQAGVAGGVADAVADGVISASNRTATRKALENGVSGTPKVADILAARHESANPSFTLE